MVSRGARDVAGQRDLGIQRARETIGSDEPGVLAELFGNIEKGAQRQFGDIVENVDVLRGQAVQKKASNLLQVGLSLNRIEEQKKAEDLRFKRDLVTGVVGGGIGLIGAGIGAAGTAKSFRELIDLFNSGQIDEDTLRQSIGEGNFPQFGGDFA
jgi:hypothetical protein